MASIHGLSIKNVKTWMGREGEAIQGDIYLGNEKICFWSQDGNGGIDNYDFERMYSESKFISLIKELYKGKHITYNEMKIEYDVDLVMEDLTELNDLQNEYIKYRTRGFQGMFVISNPFYRKSIALSKDMSKLTNAELLAEFNKEVNEFGNSKGKNDLEIRIFRDIKDFDIGEPIKKEQLYDVRKLNEFYDWEAIILSDKMITKESFEQLSNDKKTKIFVLDFVPSKKDGYFYEKDYLLNLEKEEQSKDIELEER